MLLHFVALVDMQTIVRHVHLFQVQVGRIVLIFSTLGLHIQFKITKYFIFTSSLRIFWLQIRVLQCFSSQCQRLIHSAGFFVFALSG